MGLTTEVKKTRTDYIPKEELKHLLAALMPDNRLALEISLATGLRISDVLSLRRVDVVNASCNDGRVTVRELKTGKNRRIRIPAQLLELAIGYAGRYYVFEHRHDAKKHRTRQAVYKDLKRIARMFRVHANIAPHSARKVWAVEQFRRDGNLKRVQKLLQHTSEAVTMLYAMADELSKRRGK